LSGRPAHCLRQPSRFCLKHEQNVSAAMRIAHICPGGMSHCKINAAAQYITTGGQILRKRQ
jgi:hypothetical protein